MSNFQNKKKSLKKKENGKNSKNMKIQKEQIIEYTKMQKFKTKQNDKQNYVHMKQENQELLATSCVQRNFR